MVRISWWHLKVSEVMAEGEKCFEMLFRCCSSQKVIRSYKIGELCQEIKAVL